MKLSPKAAPLGAIAALALALALMTLAVVRLRPQAAAVTFDDGPHHVHFATDADITLGRCATVRWEVSPNQGVWVNGLPRDSAGSAEACLGEFTRPQIFVVFAEDRTYFQELPVASLVHTPDLALEAAVLLLGIGLLLALSAYLAGWRAPDRLRRGLAALGAALARLDRLPRRAVIASFVVMTLACTAASLALAGRATLVPAVEEDYLNDLSLGEQWQHGSRPITVPLVFKTFDNHADRIAWFQRLFAIAAWTALAAAVALTLQHRALRMAAFGLVLLFSLTRDVIYWHSTLYSESLSISLFALLLAAALATLWLVTQRPERLTLPVQLALSAGLLVLVFLWSFARDSHAYSVLALGAGLLLIAAGGLWRPALRPRLLLPALVGIGCVIVFAMQTEQADRNLRWRLPLVNVLARRILTDADKTAFFAGRGMPTNEKVMQYAGHDQFAWSHDLDFSGFEGWLEERGRAVYLEYLLAHPWRSLREPLDHWHLLWLYDQDVIADWGQVEAIPAWQSRLTDWVYGESWVFLLLNAAGLLALLRGLWTRRLDLRHAVPLALLALAFPAAFVNWHGDAFAIARHGLGLAIQWRLALWLLIALACDRALPACG